MLTSFFTQCSKDKTPKIINTKYDYREFYTGPWQFHTQRTNFDVNWGSTTTYIDYTGKIIVGDKPHEIIVEYLENQHLILEVDENGVTNPPIYDYCYATIIDHDSLHINLRYGGLGGGVKYEITGIKVN